MSIAAVTSFTADGFRIYGKRFVETFLEHWPESVHLYVYVEDFLLPMVHPRLHARDLRTHCPELFVFKEKYAHVKQDWLHHAACKYAFKLHVVADATTTNCVAERVFWLDADAVAHAQIPLEFLREMLPLEHYTSGLFRPLPYYTECSFVGYNTLHTYHAEFIHRCILFYLRGTVFELEQWHDCWVYDTVRYQMEAEGKITSYDIGQGVCGLKHPFVNSVLGRYMDHLKGTRKNQGKSGAKDLLQPRHEEYWTN